MCQAFYFLRHGATADSPPCLKGQSVDAPLSSEGHQMMQVWAEKLTHLPFQAVIHSPAQRSQQSAQYFLKAPQKALELSHFHEVSWGEWEGLPRSKADSFLEKQGETWAKGDWNWHPPGGESLKAVYDRIETGFQLLLQLFPTGAILIISHGYTLSLLLAWLLGYPPGQRQRFHHPTGTLSWGIRNPEGRFYLQKLALNSDDWPF